MKPSVFRLAAPKKITVLAFITMIIFVAAMACDGYTIFSWKDLTVFNRAGVIWRLATSAIMLVVLIGYLCASRYRVTEKSVTFYLGIFPVSRIKKENVTELRVKKAMSTQPDAKKSADKLQLICGDMLSRIMIKPEKFSDFADALKQFSYDFSFQYDYEE